MTIVGRLAAAFVAAGMLVACGPRDYAYDPSHFHLRGRLVPPDIVPALRPNAKKSWDGIYFVYARSDEGLCCWTEPHAAPLIRKRRSSKYLHIDTYIPDIEEFRHRPQELTVTFVGFRKRTRIGHLTPGMHRDIVPVPESLQAKTGVIRIKLDTAYDAVPSPKRLGGDGLHYGVLLLSAYFD